MTGKFLQIKCADCGNLQVAFDRPATTIACLVCGATLAKSTSGKTEFHGEIVGPAE